jgi:hypothetical protein
MTEPSDIAQSANDSSLNTLERDVERAVNFSERWPETYRLDVFRVALEFLRGTTKSDSAVNPAGTLEPSRHAIVPVTHDSPEVGTPTTPIGKLALSLGVPAASLSRVVDIGDDGSIRILGRVEGRSIREKQGRLSAIYCFVHEQTSAEMYADVETLRALCIAHGAYDSANFTANFRRDQLLREVNDRPDGRRYVASKQALALAAELLKGMIDA